MWDNYKYLSLLLILFGMACCNTTEPPDENQSVNLTLEDVSCTEAWITLTTTNLPLPTTINLKQTNPNGDTKSQILNLNTKDSLLYIDSLLPNQTYKFQSVIQSINQSSNEVTATTLDTTSHNFTWQTWAFGEHSSSVIYDVAIINENSIYAVGEIYMNDTLGQPDPIRYNAVIWNGQNWTIIRIPYYYQGQPFYNPIQSVFAFEQNDIWFCGNGVIHWDGSSFIPIEIPTNVWGPYQMNKIWGSSNSDLYIVGNGGKIAQYNGTSWRKVESGTDVDIHDIWGSVNYTTGEKTILAIASFQNYGFGLDLLKINGQSASKLDTTGLRIAQSSIWFKGNNKTYVVGDGVFYKNNLSSIIWQQEENHPLLFKRLIRGKDMNDIFIVGDFGLVSHYNGITWHHYRGNELPNLNGSYYSVDYKNNSMVAVGQLNDGQAIITLGRK
jgi:hypothetical protein